jgi:hypothetical protein
MYRCRCAGLSRSLALALCVCKHGCFYSYLSLCQPRQPCSYHSRIEAGLFRKLDEDPWKLVERSMPTPPQRRRDSLMRSNDELQTHQSPLTPSAQYLVEITTAFIQDVGCVVSVDLFQPVLSVLAGIVECYFDRIAEELRSTVTYSDSQTIAMLRNCSYILYEFLPRITSHFQVCMHLLSSLSLSLFHCSLFSLFSLNRTAPEHGR